MLVIPTLDIKEGRCVRLFKGDFNQEKIYSTDPLSVAQFWEKKRARILHVVDLDGARSGEMANCEIIRQIIKTVNIPIQVAGGIRDEKTVKELLSIGAARIVLGTIAIENPELSKRIVKKYREKIIVAVDILGNGLYCRGWKNKTEISLLKMINLINKIGVRRIIYTDIGKDGTLTGVNFPKINEFMKAVKIPAIIAGGISTVNQIKKIEETGAEGVIVGKAFYEGLIKPEEVFSC